MVSRAVWVVTASVLLQCCGQVPGEGPLQLRLNEVVSNNEGAYVDEFGETDDYIEIYNNGFSPVSLGGLLLEDTSGSHALPNVSVPGGASVVLWADDDPKQGERHLPFKISSEGESLRLLASDGSVIDSVLVPPLGEHDAFARMPDGMGPFSVCEWASPGRKNGTSCGASLPPTRFEHVEFAPYTWPAAWPNPSSPLAITELALRPAQYVDVTNTSQAKLSLSEYELRIAPHAPGLPLPGIAAGIRLSWPTAELEPGARLRVPVSEAEIGQLALPAEFQAIASIFPIQATEASDWVEFMAWPEGAVLERDPTEIVRPRFCAAKAAPNQACQPLAERALGTYTNRLATSSDFEVLARGRSDLGIDSIGFLVDLTAGDSVTFLNSADWDLHYSFVRENILKLPHLNRCVPEQKAEFERAWVEFSQHEYFKVEGRKYLLGTLVRYASNQLQTVEFSPGDVISPEQMKRAFFAVMRRVPDPRSWKIRPQSADQLERVRQIEGQVPIVSPSAAFEGVEFQPLTPGLAFGTLRFVPEGRLKDEALGPRDIVITDQVPNDLPLIGGLMTEVFQTPLSHVNVLSRGRGTPNAALANARNDPRVQPLLGQLVRFEVHGSSFTLEKADPLEASRFFEQQKPKEVLVPRQDPSLRGIVPLAERGFADLPAIGGKAAQFAELSRVRFCLDASAPAAGFALPIVHYLEHFEQSGARAELQVLQQDPTFAADPVKRSAGLARVRALIEQHTLDPALVELLAQAVAQRFAGKSMRFRSSSNVEDLAGFNGAGLYTSVGVDEDDVEQGVPNAVRKVWASLWNDRAYAERDFYNVDQSAVAMAVLVHEGFPSERANGVAISRNVLEPTRGDVYYVNAQVGEALVTNPAPGVQSDEFTYAPLGYQQIVYQQRSTFSPLSPVLSADETSLLACNLGAIHDAFRLFLDPTQSTPAFAVDIEFKLVGPERRIVIKQARSFSFGKSVPDTWCDF